MLHAVEKGWIVLIGATTENPSFEVVSALLSRSQVYVLKALDYEKLEGLADVAVERYNKDSGTKFSLKIKLHLFSIPVVMPESLLILLKLC